MLGWDDDDDHDHVVCVLGEASWVEHPDECFCVITSTRESLSGGPPPMQVQRRRDTTADTRTG